MTAKRTNQKGWQIYHSQPDQPQNGDRYITANLTNHKMETDISQQTWPITKGDRYITTNLTNHKGRQTWPTTKWRQIYHNKPDQSHSYIKDISDASLQTKAATNRVWHTGTIERILPIMLIIIIFKRNQKYWLWNISLHF